MTTHGEKWRKTMLEKYGSEEAVGAFMARNGTKAKRTGKGGFKHLKNSDPEKLKAIAAIGGKISKRRKNGERTKKLEN